MAGAELGLVVVTHGRIGEELLRVASYILGGRLGRSRAVVVPFMVEAAAEFACSPTPFEARLQSLVAEISLAVTSVDEGAGVIILTDLLGGTAFNASSQLLAKEGKGVVISGVNLPMLLKVPSIRKFSLEDAASELVGRSRQAVVSRSI